jgi:hypothetical protein
VRTLGSYFLRENHRKQPEPRRSQILEEKLGPPLRRRVGSFQIRFGDGSPNALDSFHPKGCSVVLTRRFCRATPGRL